MKIDTVEMMISARQLVVKELEKEGYKTYIEDIYVVWSCKTLQNYKTILSTDAVKGYIFEVTYNGDKDEFYVDTYVKKSNCKVEV